MSSTISGRRESATAAGKTARRVTAPVRWGGSRPVRSADNDVDLLPAMRWDQFEAVLTAMAMTPETAVMARHLLAGARRDAAHLPVEETIREILCIGAAVAAAERPTASAA